VSQYWWFAIIAVVLAAAYLALAAAYLWRPRRKVSRIVRLAEARRRFHAQRERLEAKFVQIAAAREKSHSAGWADCSFADDVAYVRNRATGELSAFVAVTVGPEEGASSPHGPAGTAVFRFDQDHWEPAGRVFLNLSPSEAVRHYGDDFEIVGEEVAQRS
jgi:hypothetical protein